MNDRVPIGRGLNDCTNPSPFAAKEHRRHLHEHHAFIALRGAAGIGAIGG